MENKELIVLSLFDGISCGQIALQRAGFNVKTYYASEIDKYAIKITQKNFPNTIQLGDITQWKTWDIDWSTIDLLFAGFPCQAWSLAGHQQGDKDPRGQLMWVMLDIYNHIKALNPKVYFLFENVKMKKQFADYVNNAIGVTPVLIDSALVSAQTRKRAYWTNIQGISQPEDKHIYLYDIIESGVVDRDKSFCIDANYFKGGNLVQYFEKSRRQLIFDKPIQIGYIKKNQQGRRVYATNGKNITLKASGGGWGAKTGLILQECNKSKTIRSGGRNSPVGDKHDWDTVIYQRPHGANQGGIKGLNGKTPTMTSSQWQYNNLLLNEFIIRKLTPIECERLQTIPDNYTDGISNSQRYKCLGNGWTVDVIVHILKHMRF